MDELEYIEFISEKFSKCLNKYIERSWIRRSNSIGVNFQAHLAEENCSYANSKYYYNGENLRFIHWTSVDNLLSIINHRQLRLYNLHNCKDRTEFSHSARVMSIKPEKIEHSKSFLYTISLCEAKELSNPYLWKKYGRNYRGIAIEFEIVNDPMRWNKFMLSKVYYGLPRKFINLQKELIKLMSDHPQVTCDIDLGRLICFYKHARYKRESEVRLAVYFPFNQYHHYDSFCDKEFRLNPKRPRITEYFKLPLWVDNNSSYVRDDDDPYLDRTQKLPDNYFDYTPQLKISQIHFGKNCGVNNSQFYSTFYQTLLHLILNKLGYKVNLEMNLYGR